MGTRKKNVQHIHHSEGPIKTFEVTLHCADVGVDERSVHPPTVYDGYVQAAKAGMPAVASWWAQHDQAFWLTAGTLPEPPDDPGPWQHRLQEVAANLPG